MFENLKTVFGILETIFGNLKAVFRILKTMFGILKTVFGILRSMFGIPKTNQMIERQPSFAREISQILETRWRTIQSIRKAAQTQFH
jgi:hypothetical protein